MMTFLQNSGILFPKPERGKKREGKRQIAKQFFMLSSKQSKSLLFSKEFCHLDWVSFNLIFVCFRSMQSSVQEKKQVSLDTKT